MNANPTESPTLLEVALPWAVWGLALAAVAVVAWWAFTRLRRSGHLTAAFEYARRLLVTRTTPKASPSVPPASPHETASAPPATRPEGSDRPPRTRIIVAAASVPSVLSLIWFASTVAETIGGPGGWAAGVFADVLIVSTVAIAWFNPEVRRLAGVGGWVAALAAGVLLGWHHWGTEQVVFSLVPIGSKFLWHVALTARTAWEARVARTEAERLIREAEVAARKEEAARATAEEKALREAELSTELSHERKVELARLDEDAAYIEEKSERELRVAEARAKAEHAKKVADVRRLGEEQRAMDEEAAKVEMARQELTRRVNASRPASFALPSAEVPSDLSSLSAPPGAAVMGFGAAMGSDLGVPRGRPVVVPAGIDPELKELVTYIASAGDDVSVRGAAKELKVAPATIRRWRTKAEEAGLDMSALKPTT